MSVILNFFVSNYVWFLVISFILIFALIGYFVDTKKDERFSEKIEIDKELESRLAAAGAANLTINQMMQSPVKSEEDAVEALEEEALDESPKAEETEQEKKPEKTEKEKKDSSKWRIFFIISRYNCNYLI